MKIIFMGTPDFAVGTLEALVEAGHEVVLAVTQPDKPKGRGKTMQFPPIKEAALAHNIEVYQPKKVREPECVEFLKKYGAELIVVVAFGQILSEEILKMPKYGCINVHASLLPKYRGAAPIQWSILNGESVTGVTIMQMDAGVDTGDMLEQVEVPIQADETGGSLFDKLASVGAKLCIQAIAHIQDGTAKAVKQNEALASHTGKITKDMGKIDWQEPADVIERKVRGLNPWPGAYTRLNGKTLKIWKAQVFADQANDTNDVSGLQEGNTGVGHVVLADKSRLVVQTGEGKLSLLELQLEGKKRMSADAFLCGCQIKEGEVLGS